MAVWTVSSDSAVDAKNRDRLGDVCFNDRTEFVEKLVDDLNKDNRWKEAQVYGNFFNQLVMACNEEVFAKIQGKYEEIGVGFVMRMVDRMVDRS